MKMLELMEGTDRTWRLLESLPQHLILLEDRIDWMRKNLLPRLEKAAEEQGWDPEHLFNYILKRDPTKKKIYAQWIIKLLIAGEPDSEFAYLKELLSRYDEFKKDPDFPEHLRDINRFQSFEELRKAVRNFAEEKANQQAELQQEINSETEFVDENQKWRVVTPLSDRAAAYWGRRSNWCTARGYSWCKHPDRTSMFPEYNDAGTLMIFINQNNSDEIYQL